MLLSWNLTITKTTAIDKGEEAELYQLFHRVMYIPKIDMAVGEDRAWMM